MINQIRELEKSFLLIEDQTRKIFDSVQDLIIQIDIDKNITWTNKATKSLYPDAVGNKCCEALWGGSNAFADCPCQQTMGKGKYIDGSKIRYSENGKENDIEWETSSFPSKDENGNITGAWIIKRDVTRTNRLEEEIKLQQKQLFQADKMISLGILVSGIAHEINNPNNSIMLDISLLQRAWNDAQPILDGYRNENGVFDIAGIEYEKFREKLPVLFQSTLKCSKKIQHIVKELRDYSGENSICFKQDIDMEAAAKSAISITDTLIKKTTRHFKAVFQRNLPPVRGNFQNIEQVIINLLQNSCQAIDDPAKGIFLSVTLDNQKEEIVLSIKDEGCGIPEEDMGKIKEPFFTSKRGLGGTGLGLYISSQIVNDHAGTMSFQSKVSEGTTAQVRFPIKYKDIK